VGLDVHFVYRPIASEKSKPVTIEEKVKADAPLTCICPEVVVRTTTARPVESKLPDTGAMSGAPAEDTQAAVALVAQNRLAKVVAGGMDAKPPPCIGVYNAREVVMLYESMPVSLM
jgi:hypothetical protein